MKKLGLDVKAFFRSKGILFFTLAFIATVFSYIIKTSIKMYPLAYEDNTDAFFCVFSDSQWLTYFIFILFMFLSYEMFLISKKNSILETLSATPRGIKNTYLNQFLILEILNAIITIMMMCIVIFMAVRFNVLSFEFLIHITINFLLNYIFIITLAILIGFLLAVYIGKIISYVLMIIIAFLTSSVSEDIASTIYVGLGIDVYGFTNLFNIFTPNYSSMPLFAFGLSILPYRFEVVFFWIFLIIAIIIIKSKDFGKGFLIKRILPVFFCLLAIFNLIGYCIPQSKVIRDNQPSHANFSDTFYYEVNNLGNNVKKEADFDIIKYTMNIKIRNILYADVTMKLSRDDIDEYEFTLYHGYKVENVCDSEGKELQFNQKSDKLTIYTEKKTDELTVSYSGFSPRYYANIQGIFLPAGFVYYPVAGVAALFSEEEHVSVFYLPKNDIDFDVTVDYGKHIFCNFESSEPNRFQGKSNALTLVSGFYKEMTIGKITFICPYLDGSNTRENYEKYIVEELGDDIKIFKNKKIFVVPNLNQGSVCVSASDHFISHSTIGSIFSVIEEKEREE